MTLRSTVKATSIQWGCMCVFYTYGTHYHYRPNPRGQEAVKGQIFWGACILFYVSFPLIWYTTLPPLDKKVLTHPTPGVQTKSWTVTQVLLNLPIGQRPIALLDSSKSINIKSISTAATIYLMSTALQNCKINCLYSVLPGETGSYNAYRINKLV